MPGDPTLALPSTETLPIGSTIPVSGVSYQDSAAASNPGAMYLRVSDAAGALNSSINGSAVSGSGTNSLTLSTTYSRVTAALSNLTYTASPTPGFDAINFDLWNQYGVETTGRIPVTITGPISTGPWVETWAASSEPPVLAPGGPDLTAPSFNNQTIREVVQVSAGGSSMRLRFSNLFRDTPLSLGAVHIALADANGAIVPGTDHTVTFGGQQSTTIAANSTAESDPLTVPVSSNTNLAVSLYLPNDTGPVTWNQFGDISPIGPGNQTGATTLSSNTSVFSRPVLAGIDVQGQGTDGTVVALGDSITVVEPDVNQNDRWTDDLSRRLQASSGLSHLAVVNAGISGNRVLADGTGPSALSRFQRDVISAPGAKYVVVEEGINDIGANSSAQAIESGYSQLINAAHAAGLRIIGTTITPFGGTSYDTPVHEAVRDELNAWIRNSGAFDGIVDFDAAVRDPGRPQWWLPAYDNGSHLHPNGAGAAAMADAVNLQLFSATPTPPPPPSGPVLNEPSSETVATGSMVGVPGSYSDPFAQSNPGFLYLGISDTRGTLRAVDASGGSVPGTGTSNIGFSTNFANLNAALGSLTYTAPLSSGSDKIRFDVWNQAGVETMRDVPVTITGSPPSSGPTLNVPSSQIVSPNTSTPISGAYSDSFAAGNPGTLFLGISDNAGTLAATDKNGNSVPGSGTNRIALAADYVDVNTILRGLHYTAPSGTTSDTINFDVWNQAGVETSGATHITVSPVALAIAGDASGATPSDLLPSPPTIANGSADLTPVNPSGVSPALIDNTSLRSLAVPVLPGHV